MYTREERIKKLKIKNVIFNVIGIFNIATSVAVMVSLISVYRDRLETVLYAKATPESVVSTLIGIILLIIAGKSREYIGDANFYSSYFEGDLDGYVTYSDLAEVMGKSEKKVKKQLHFFQKIYMKNYELKKIDHVEQVVLNSKKYTCECRNCGAPIEKRAYFTGVCSYCGSSDLFAKVLTDNRFYSIANNMSAGVKKPAFYSAANLRTKIALFVGYLGIGVAVMFFSTIGIFENIANYNDEEYLGKLLLSGESYASFKLIKNDIMENIIWCVVLILALVPVVVDRGKKITYASAAVSCAEYFSGCKNPFVNVENLPLMKSGSNKKRAMHSVRSALRRRYLRNCTLEKHDGALKVALAKTIVKDKCPSCNGPIVGAVDEHYRCKYCNNIIMDVVRKR